MTIVLTWAMFKWAGLVLFILSVIGFWNGSLPDHGGTAWGNTLRWVSWPLLALWTLVFLIRGIVL